ncbi:hypothetical protein BaRGS_00011581, partial [Batillaria attramentaria]
PCDIPKDAGSERCGTSGLPVLELVKDTKEVRKLQVYTHGNSCPAPGLVFKDGVCCFDTEKVGQCVKPGDFGICVLNCASDNDCPGSQKCCPTGCSGSFTCSDPVSEITCLTASPDLALRFAVLYRSTLTVQTPAKWTRTSQGCVHYFLARRPVMISRSQLVGTSVKTTVTVKATTSVAGAVTDDCRPGQVCIMQQVVCVTSPCFPVPTCIGTDPKPGECPIPQPGQVSTCDFRCQYDEECPLQEKCCKTACGGTGCREPQLDLTCANVLCVVNTICREVLDRTTGVVSPSCI